MNYDKKRRNRLKRAMRDDALLRVCYVCGENAHVFHHTSYEPEETVMVCPTCHNEIHGNHHVDLLPRLKAREEVKFAVNSCSATVSGNVTQSPSGV